MENQEEMNLPVTSQMTRAEQNLTLLRRMIPANEKLYIWCFRRDLSPVASSCPEDLQDLLLRTFTALSGMEKLKAYLTYIKEAEENREGSAIPAPVLFGTPIGMQWAVTCEIERSRELLFVLGPVFYSRPSEEGLKEALIPYDRSNREDSWSSRLLEHLQELPVISHDIFDHYVIMIHNTLTDQNLGLEALNRKLYNPDRKEVLPSEELKETQGSAPSSRDRIGVYRAEQALLQMVREGDINYQSALIHSMGISPGVPVRGRDPLRQMKTSIIVFATLVTRAAMEGGLSPEIAYPLGDSYIQAAEDCRDSGELSALSHTLYHDFIYRVHHLHMDPGYSHAVRKVCDYIELGLERKMRTKDLAALVGYSEYYLTEKFKKETGESVSSYIKKAKIRRAETLLKTTDLSVQEIADRLAFNTPNYFIQCFREITGLSPSRYRKEQREH